MSRKEVLEDLKKARAAIAKAIELINELPIEIYEDSEEYQEKLCHYCKKRLPKNKKQVTRGVHRAPCYNEMRKLVENKEATWEQFIEAGQVEPPGVRGRKRKTRAEHMATQIDMQTDQPKNLKRLREKTK